jgi:hypothetical protein
MPLCAPVEIIMPFGNSKDLSPSSCDHLQTTDNDCHNPTFEFEIEDKEVRAMFEKMLLDCDDDDYSVGSSDSYSDDSSCDSKPQEPSLFDDDSISLRKRSISSAIDSMMNANDKAESGKLRPFTRTRRPTAATQVEDDDDESAFEDFVVPVKDC